MKMLTSSLLALVACIALHAQTATATAIDSAKPESATRAERQIQVADLVDAIVQSGSCNCGGIIGVLILNSYRARSTMGGF